MFQSNHQLLIQERQLITSTFHCCAKLVAIIQPSNNASSAYQANGVLMLLSLVEFTKIKDGKDF